MISKFAIIDIDLLRLVIVMNRSNHKNNKISKIKGSILFIAILLFASFFAITFFAAKNVKGGLRDIVSTSSTNGLYTVNNLQIGDYIDGFGTWDAKGDVGEMDLKWRVIDKDDNGTLVRLDYLLPDSTNANNTFLVNGKDGDSTQSYINSEFDWVSKLGTKQGTVSDRKSYGTNYWEQSNLKKFVNQFEQTAFDSVEQKAIKQNPQQKQLLHMIDVAPFYHTDEQNTADGTTNQLINKMTDGYKSGGSNDSGPLSSWTVKNFESTEDWTLREQGKKREVFNKDRVWIYNYFSRKIILDVERDQTSVDILDLMSEDNEQDSTDNQKVSFDESAYYFMDDSVFVLDAKQVVNISVNSKNEESKALKNKNGDGYYKVLNIDGQFKASFTRTPATSGDAITDTFLSIDTTGNKGFLSNYSNDYNAVAPAFYLSNEGIYSNKTEAIKNPGEPNDKTYYEYTLDKDKTAQEKPEIINDELTIETDLNTAYSVEIISTGKGVVFEMLSGTMPKGLEFFDTGVISGTPKQYGKFSFDVAASNAKGNANAKITLTIKSLSTIDLGNNSKSGSWLHVMLTTILIASALGLIVGVTMFVLTQKALGHGGGGTSEPHKRGKR